MIRFDTLLFNYDTKIAEQFTLKIHFWNWCVFGLMGREHKKPRFFREWLWLIYILIF